MEEPIIPTTPQSQLPPVESKSMSRWYRVGFVIIPTVFCIVSYILFGLTFGCAWSGGSVECHYVGLVTMPFNLGSIIFLFIFVACSKSDQYRSNYKLAAILFWSYVIAAAIALGVPYSMGLIHDAAEGTETACELEVRNGYCYLQLAKANNDLELCDKIGPDQDWAKRDCLKYFASKSGNASLCVENDVLCLEEAALTKKDAEMCDAIKTNDGVRTRCYNQIAKTLGDPSICLANDGKYCNYVIGDPEKYVTASDVDIMFEVIGTELKSGQHNASIIKATARARTGVAVLQSIEFSLDSDIASEWLLNPGLFDDRGGREAWGSLYSYRPGSPSFIKFQMGPDLVGDKEPVVYLFTADIAAGKQGKMTAADFSVMVSGNTREHIDIKGGRVITINK